MLNVMVIIIIIKVIIIINFIIIFQNSSFAAPEAPKTFEFEIRELKTSVPAWLMSHAGTEVFNFQISNSKFKSFGGLRRHETRILKNIFWRHTQN